MEMIIFSNSAAAKRWTASAKSKKSLSITMRDPSDLKKYLKNPDEGSIVYIEATSETEIRKYAKTLSQAVKIWGVFDPSGAVEDPALVFHLGAADYIGKKTCLSEPLPARFSRVDAYIAEKNPEIRCIEKPKEAPKLEWSSVVPGKEYDFDFLLVQYPDAEVLRKKLGEDRFKRFREEFMLFLKKNAELNGGRLWMTLENSFLVLFPLGQAETSPAIIALRLYLNRVLYGVEIFNLGFPLDLKICVHRGQTTWKEPGRTGTVVSETVNFIFHMAKKLIKTRGLCVSADSMPVVPDRMKPYLDSLGGFEGKDVFALSKPIE